MKHTAIPDDVAQFIQSQIPSVPYLEALLLLRSAPDAGWTVARLSRRLYQTEKSANTILSGLHASGVAQKDGKNDAYHYRPHSEELRAMIDRVAAAYASNLVGISTLIHSVVGAKATSKVSDAPNAPASLRSKPRR